MKCHLRNINAIDRDFPGIHIVKTADEIYDRGFSCPGRADDRIRFTRFCRKIDILQNLLPRLITKGHMGKLHFSCHLRHLDCIRLIPDTHRLIDRLKNPLKIRDCCQKRIVKSGKCVDWCPETPNVRGKCDQNTDGQCHIRC